MIQSAACVRTQEAAPAPPPIFEVIGEWGTPGEGPGKLQHPVSLAVDADGLVYVADAGSGYVHKFDWEGQPLFSFNHPRMKRPSGIAVDDGRAIYVADTEAGRVFVFYPDGRLLREMRGGPGKVFRAPAGVAVDSLGFIYVADSKAHRVQKLDARGRHAKSWGVEGSEPGNFHAPADVAVAPDGFVYVADSQNHRVQKFSRNGEWLAAWTAAGSAHQQNAATGGIAAGERLLVFAGAGSLPLQAWNSDGTLRHAGALDERLREPAGLGDVAIGKNQELLLLDSSKARVLRVRVNF